VHNNKKKQIMRAVEKLAAKQTLYEITLDEVAREAKIGKGTIYHYFENKEDLFFEVATSGFDELCELLRREVADNGTFSVKFRKMCSLFIRFFAARQQLLKIMQTQASHTYWSKSRFRERWTSKRKNLVKAVSDIISEGAAEGMIRRDISTDFLAVSLLGMLRAYARDSNGSAEITKRSELLVNLFLNGACNTNNRLAAHWPQTIRESK